MDETQKRAHVLVSGRVQGVNFRAATRDQARQAGLRGWVRNRSDGRVEAVFEGPIAAVHRLVSWCHSGPPSARVDRVEVTWEEPDGDEGWFDIRW
ncbi:MAG: acylphosphatase [Chloroflexaceae bacterium]|nr:acylphosphatase [Chloroflexaceae bacterium]